MVGTRKLSSRELALMERLMLNKQGPTRKFLVQMLSMYYDQKDLIISDDYLGAKGTIPIAVAAHMDTVWETSVGHEVFYDRRKNVMVNLRGGGYDDKVGIFMILKLLESGYRPHVIFCANEEVGSLGAEAFVKAYPECPFEDCRFIIMLDRRGHNDCVFYDCENDEFEKYCEDFGFKTAWGSFTDICTLCPAWGMAGVNFSVGYVDEHTPNEKLYVGTMFETLRKVESILSQPEEQIPYFKYIPMVYGSWQPFRWNHKSARHYYGGYYDYDYYDYDDKALTYSEGGWYDDSYDNMCWGCGKDLTNVDATEKISFIDESGYPVSYCAECAAKYVDFCDICGQPFEIDEKHPNDHICPACRADIESNKYGKWSK